MHQFNPLSKIDTPTPVRPGISVLLAERQDLLAGKRIGVLTNASGVLPDLTITVDALIAVADVRALFAPEHGVLGAAAEGAHVEDGVHRSGIPIHSLYGEQLAPTSAQLADLDVIVCDIQDVGCRFYTYAWTVIKTMEAAARAKVTVIIADRPNPLGGAIEGPGVEDGYRTLVGLHDVPIRHGLTLGEIARLVNRELSLGCDLQVVPCDGWRRAMWWDATGLPWVPPSPNMPTLDTATVYPGTCLLEGVNVSVGRGTSRPFEWLGAPWIDPVRLTASLNALELPGVRWRPVAFEPCVAPYAGATCFGVQPHVIDRDAYRPVAAGVALLWALRATHGDRFAISPAAGIYADPESMRRRGYASPDRWQTAHFDRLAGSMRLRESLLAGASVTQIVAAWSHTAALFRSRSHSALLYH